MAVGVREPDIQEDDASRLAGQGGQGLLAAGRGAHRQIQARQGPGDAVAHRVIIIHHQDLSAEILHEYSVFCFGFSVNEHPTNEALVKL
jgi:hypothetical protein